MRKHGLAILFRRNLSIDTSSDSSSATTESSLCNFLVVLEDVQVGIGRPALQSTVDVVLVKAGRGFAAVAMPPKVNSVLEDTEVEGIVVDSVEAQVAGAFDCLFLRIIDLGQAAGAPSHEVVVSNRLVEFAGESVLTLCGSALL